MNVLLQKYSKAKKMLYMCFVDFKNAYDSVWRKALMLKILETGIRGNMFNPQTANILSSHKGTTWASEAHLSFYNLYEKYITIFTHIHLY